MKFKSYPKYKASGVEWLGDVPEEWEIKPIKSIATWNDDVLDEKTEPLQEILYIDISSVDAIDGIKNAETILFKNAPSRARRKVRDGDVIVSTVRTYLRAIASIKQPDENMVVSTGFAVLRPLQGLVPDFASYLFSASYVIEDVIARSTGVSYPAINASDLVRIAVATPPVEQQSAIAAFLDHETAKIDTLIAKQENLIDLLKEKRQAVISHAVTKGLDPTVTMKPSGVEWLGVVPEHWEVKRLRYVLSKNGLIRGPFGGDLKKEIFVKSGIKIYEQKNAIYQDAELGDSYISQQKFSEMNRFVVRAGDYIMSCSGTIGKVYRLPDGAPEGIINQALLKINFDEKISNEFADWIFIADFFASQIIDNSQGGAMKNLVGMNIFTSISLPAPSIQEQFTIATFLNRETTKIDTLISKAQQAITLQKEHRTALISAAVTGKIDVRNIACKAVDKRSTQKFNKVQHANI